MRSALVVLFLMLVTTSAHSAVTNLRLYRLGEADPGALPGNPGDDPTRDSVSPADAAKVGLEFYHFQINGNGPPTAVGLVPGSTESMRFVNVDSRYVAPAATGLTEYGMEVYVQPNASVSGLVESRLFYNGGDGSPIGSVVRGLGVGIGAGQYVGIVNGVVWINSGVPAVPGTPVELAIVAHGGLVEMFVQRQSVGSSAVVPLAAAAGDGLSLGNFIANFSPPGFAGALDEARVFTFGPGGFDPVTDLGPEAAPEPTSPVLGLAVALMTMSRRRLKRR